MFLMTVLCQDSDVFKTMFAFDDYKANVFSIMFIHIFWVLIVK